VLGFTQEEKDNIYQIVASVMHMGEMKFKQRGREEQAEADEAVAGGNVSFLLGLDGDELYKAILKPRIKVGNEFVTQGRNKDQVLQYNNQQLMTFFVNLFPLPLVFLLHWCFG
jgi:myosin heavy subunit